MKVLFICKKGQAYSKHHYSRAHSGLFNSTLYIVEALLAKGIIAKIVDVIDNNSIDKEVALFKPDVVIIEALWVVPEKFIVLKKLHPHVKWYVHVHSNIPFLANEGIAIEWILRQEELGVGLIANSEFAYEALRAILCNITYLPNIYISKPELYKHKPKKKRKELNIGCFGAIRPMKNQLTQAIAAIKYAKEEDKHLRFHINSTRIENSGESIIRNLEHLFEDEDNATLVHHQWYHPHEFIKILQGMDIGMQVSMSETFNVVTADYVTAGLPVVVSDEIKWITSCCYARTDSVDSIVQVMERVSRSKMLVKWNQFLLKQNEHHATKLWGKFLE